MLDLYLELIKSYGLTVNDEGMVMLEDKPLQVNKKPLALPMSNVLNNLMVENNDGTLTAKYTLFNPLYENMVSSRNIVMEAFTKMSHNHIAAFVGSIMFDLIEALKSNSKDSNLINISIKVQSIKGASPKLFSDATVNKIVKIVSTGLSTNNLIKFFIKKNMVHEGESYTRVLLAKYHYADLDKEDLEKEIGIKLSRKEYDLFQILYRDIMDYATDMDKVIMTSNDKLAPTASTLFRGYAVIISKLKKYSIEHGLGKGYIDIAYKLDSFVDMSTKYGKELSGIVKIDDEGHVLSTPIDKPDLAKLANQQTVAAARDSTYHENYVRPDVNGNVALNGTTTVATSGPSELDILDMMAGIKPITGMGGMSTGNNAMYATQPATDMFGRPITQPQMIQQPMMQQPMMYQQQPQVNPNAGGPQYVYKGTDAQGRPVYQEAYASATPAMGGAHFM